MLQYMTAKDAAEKWNISQRRVSVLCSENRILNAAMLGKMWIIPVSAQKPLDARVQNNKFDNQSIHPFVKWAGGKSQSLETLLKFMPENISALKKYAEPMVGGGALFFKVLSKYKFEKFYISDINAELINSYKVIKTDVEKLINKLYDLQTSFLTMDDDDRKDLYYKIRDEFNSTALSDKTAINKAAEFIFLNKTCFNGLYRVNRKGEFNVPMGAYKNPTICDKENLRNISKALKNVEIVCGDYSLSESFIDKDTFVYLDPPYRPISETSGFTAYTSEVFNDDEQIRLSKFIDEMNKKGAKFILSNSDPKNVKQEDNFFDDLYNEYRINRVSATRMINSNAEKRGKINELIICN